ncbi:MAG: hypothetical protein OEM52_12215 [bacterium]|nr:hypothetical protein [bacterium]
MKIWIRPAILFGIIGGALFLQIGCFKIPQKPQWDFGMTLPFAERVYYLRDLIRMNADSVTDPALRDSVRNRDQGFYGLNDTLVFFVTGEIDNETFLDKLESDSQAVRNFSYNIDTLILGPFDCGNVAFSSQQFGFPPDTIPNFPGAAIDVTREYDSNGQGFVYFEYYDYASGDMYVEVTNEMPVALDNVHVQLLNLQDEIVGLSDTLTAIPSMHVDSLTIKITSTSRRVNADMKVRILGRLHSGTNVVFAEESRAALHLFTGIVKATAAQAQMQRQVATADTLIATDMNDEIQYADIRIGTLNISIENQLPVALDSLRVRFPDFATFSGTELGFVETNIPANQTRVRRVSLVGYTIRLDSISASNPEQRIHAIGKSWTRATTGTQMVTMSLTDAVNFDYNLSDLTFSRFKGKPDSVEFEFDTVRTDVENRPDGVDSLGLRNADFVVAPKSSVQGIPIIMDLQLDAYSPRGIHRTYSITNQSFPDINAERRFPGAEQILNIVPDRIISTGKARTGKRFISNMPTIELSEADSLYGSASIEGPMMFRLAPQKMQPDPEQSSGDDRPITQVDLRIMGENRLPVGADTVLIEISQDTAVSRAQWHIIGRTSVRRPIIDDSTRRVISFTTFDTTFVLRDSVIRIFEKPTFYVRQTLYMSGSPDTVLCNINDFIKIRASARLTINTGEVN